MTIPQFSLSTARKLQQKLAKQVTVKEIRLDTINLIAGADVSYKNNIAASAIVILNYNTLSLVEVKRVESQTEFPYIPTLLAFREASPILKAFKQLHKKPNLLIVEGHGLAHPYRCGLASYIGVILKIPTIGVAKNLLCGTPDEYHKGRAYIFHEGETVGMSLLTKPKTKPIYISVGNLITLKQAVEVTIKTIHESRMPEPLRLAHKFARLVVH